MLRNGSAGILPALSEANRLSLAGLPKSRWNGRGSKRSGFRGFGDLRLSFQFFVFRCIRSPLTRLLGCVGNVTPHSVRFAHCIRG